MYLKAASSLILLSLLCSCLTAKDAGSKRRSSWLHHVHHKSTYEVRRNNAGIFESATPTYEVRQDNNAGSLKKTKRTEKDTYSRPKRSSNREIRSGNWEGRRGFDCWVDDIYVPTHWMCDGEGDCPMRDDSIYQDELFCFECGHENLIHLDKVCNGETDCTNGLDEEVCFECGRGRAVHYRSVCDGVADCNGRSDEDCLDCGGGNFINFRKFCNGITDCTNGRDEHDCFDCGNGTVTHFRRLCDGHTDCTNGRDEDGCFNCRDGDTIYSGRVCDGFPDCTNELDENGCQFTTCHGNDEDDCLNATCPNEHHYCRCNSGNCTFHVYRCDGKQDCDDKSDELDCYAKPCPEDHYTCPDGRCKGRMYFCEYAYLDRYSYFYYIRNFKDRSDHSFCPRSPGGTYKCHNYTCFDTVNMFQCTTGECIKASDRCDLVNNCPDGSDELACENHTCSLGDFQCDSGHCISWMWLCEPHRRCPDNSDKMECASNACSGHLTQCADGPCLDLDKWCDHTPDCFDESDETSCENHTCEIFHFRCNSGQCISRDKQCDNKADCFDMSDEANCQFTCPSFHISCDDDLCYPMYKHCDGLQDCLDNSDENNCVNGTLCPEGHHPCMIKSSQCVPRVYFCDGIVDCNDTTDESDCFEDDPTCSNKAYYKCSNGRCIPLRYMCESDYTSMWDIELDGGFIPCADEPNNDTCTSYQCRYTTTHFRCNTGYCISVERRCNLRVDCPDGSDEDNCESKCDGQTFNCSNGLCVARSAVCDRIIDCGNGGDERNCFFQCTSDEYHCESGHCIPMTGLCNGYFEVNDWDRCPVFHDDEKYCPFMNCPSHYLRMPTGGCSEIKDRSDINCSTSETADVCTNSCLNNLYYIQCCDCSCVHRVSICDGIQDCPDGADERNCGRVECRPDQFYCGNITCFPVELRCDGYSHCPHGHDEDNCTLTGTSLTQNSRTMTKPKAVAKQNDNQQACFDPSICFTAYQICQSIGQCNMEIDNTDCFLLCGPPCVCQSVGQMFCKQRIENYDALLNDDSKLLWPFNTSSKIYSRNSNFGNSLFFTFEIVSTVSITHASLQRVPTRLLSCALNIQHLDLSHNAITHIAVGDFGRLYLLILLDLSNNLITSIEDFSFKGIRVLELRLSENQIFDFGIDLFSGMAIDRSLKTDDYRFCCVRPNHLPEHNCYPRPDQFSSCKDLMKNAVLSVMVWVMGLLTFVGNISVILLMITVEKESLTKTHGVLITNLAVADAFMGVYLLSIGSVDTIYRDIYITKDYEWRNSVWCSLVGVLCMISSEASVFFISLITVDRYLIVKYPFGQVRLSRSHIIPISLCVWLSSIAIAVIPVAITPYFKGTFYSKSGVCIALPLTTESFDGWEYSFTISVCLNFIMLVIVGVGQYLIVREIVLTGRNSLVSTRRRKDFAIAIKLTFIVITDVCCWVPIGVLGIMALTGFEIHPDTYAWVVVFVLPLNSVLNPFLYTIISQLSKLRAN